MKITITDKQFDKAVQDLLELDDKAIQITLSENDYDENDAEVFYAISTHVALILASLKARLFFGDNYGREEENSERTDFA